MRIMYNAQEDSLHSDILQPNPLPDGPKRSLAKATATDSSPGAVDASFVQARLPSHV